MEEKTGRFKLIIPWTTLGLVLIQLMVFMWQRQAANVGLLGYIFDDYDFNWGLFSKNWVEHVPRLVSYTFFHADIHHLFFNLLFLILFSPPVEARVGSLPYLCLYFFWGGIGALVQGFFTPYSPGLIGSSGAISGAMGAYFVLYPLRGTLTFFPLGPLQFLTKIPSFIWISLWFGSQVYAGYMTLLPENLESHIAQVGYWAHVGGFGAGAITIFPIVFLKNRPKN